MKTNHEYFGEGTAFPPRHTATQAGFLRQYFPFLKTGEFILPPQHKKGHTLLQGRVLIYLTLYGLISAWRF